MNRQYHSDFCYSREQNFGIGAPQLRKCHSTLLCFFPLGCFVDQARIVRQWIRSQVSTLAGSYIATEPLRIAVIAQSVTILSTTQFFSVILVSFKNIRAKFVKNPVNIVVLSMLLCNSLVALTTAARIGLKINVNETKVFVLCTRNA